MSSSKKCLLIVYSLVKDSLIFLELYMIDQLLTDSLIWASFQRYFVCDVAVISECRHAFIQSYTVTGDLGLGTRASLECPAEVSL